MRLLASRHHDRLRNERATRSESSTLRLSGKVVVVAVPHTYMNDSGVAVSALARRYVGGEAARVVVVHDELDLPPGTVRVKQGGGLAGHNGLRSIAQHLHTQDFLRVRIGVGKPPGPAHGADHVLRRPARAERELLAVAIELAADAVECLASEGPPGAMNRFNSHS